MRRLWVLATVALWSEAFANPPIAPDLNSVAAKLTFEPGRTSLTATAKIALRPVIDTLQSRRSARLMIVGHFGADTDAHMDVTARRRAEVVKWFLVDNGIETDRIDTSVSPVIVPGRVIELQLGGVPEQAPRAPSPIPAVAPTPAPAIVPPHDVVNPNDALATPITFETGRTSLTTAAQVALEPVVELLHVYPTARLLIVGHFDADTGAHMDVTARRRADVVKWFLVDKGIETDRIDTNVSSVRIPGQVIELQLVGSRAGEPPVHVDTPSPDHSVSKAEHEERDASQMAQLLGDEADTSSTTHHTAGANLAEQIAAAHAQSVTIGGSEGGFRGGDPVHIETAPSAVLDLHSPMIVSSTAKHAEDDVGRTLPGSAHDDATVAPAKAILRKLDARYKRGLSRCYRRTLAIDPDLSGRVALSFTVDQAGKVIGATAEADDPDLGSCSRLQMKSWRFDARAQRTTVTTTIVLQAR